MLRYITHEGNRYPLLQTEGNASQFAIPFAKKFCFGRGVDVGFCKEDWKFPGAIGADLNDDTNEYHALNLPQDLDYIYSSHCLEHVDDWVSTMEYWCNSLRRGGILFLYLPDPSQTYWLPWNNRKHKHILYNKDVSDCAFKFGVGNGWFSKEDLNSSYCFVGEKL